MASLESGRRVLVVDDDAAVRNLLARLLAMQGLVVDMASDGTTALGLLEQHPYTLLITDLEMPGLSGVDLILEVRTRGMMHPILLLSSKLDNEVRKKLGGAGRLEYLAKPFTLDAIRAAIERLVQAEPP
jgi:DNA-binding response OmpR family regulator